jgi:HlyD family secretion protein
MKPHIITFLQGVYTNILKHKILATLCFLSLLSFSCYFFFVRTTTSVTYQYATVMRGSVSSIVSSTGQVAPSSQVELKPKVNANVTGVYVKAGDRVRTGQVLFRLDATDAYKQVRDAKTSLASASIALEKLRNPKSIDVMSINDSLTKEEESMKDQDTKVALAYKNLLNAGLQALPEISYTAETAPTITGSYSQGIEGQIKIVVYQGGASGYSFTTSGLVTSSGDVNTSVAQPIGDSGLYIKWAPGTPQTNWIIAIPNKQSSSYLSNYNSWQSAITTRDTTNAASQRTILSLKQKLADLTPTDDDLDVKSAKIQVQQRENALLDAQQTLSNYTITAPFDGVMASVTGDIGVSAVMASSNSSTALGTIVTDKKMAQITLNESDIVKVRLGQKAKVTFDAIDGLVVEGTIVEINTLGTVTSGVVSYKVKVAFNTDDIRILPNMSVAVDILTDNKDNILYLPSQAVKRDGEGYYVEKESTSSLLVNASSTRRTASASSTFNRSSATGTVSSSSGFSTMKGTSTRRRGSSGVAPQQTGMVSVLVRIPVTIGIQSDTATEITAGLQEGEQVILKKTTVIGTTSTAAPSVTSLLRPQTQRTTAGAVRN